MEIYCISCKTYTGNENSVVRKTKQNRLNFLPSCSICDKKILLKIKNSTYLMINLK